MFSTHIHLEVNGMASYPDSDHRLLGALAPLIAFQGCQSDNDFLPRAGSHVSDLILSLNNPVSTSGLGGLLGVPGPLGAFILLVPFLMTVGTLISPSFLSWVRAS
jgi:hypothetical protein